MESVRVFASRNRFRGLVWAAVLAAGAGPAWAGEGGADLLAAGGGAPLDLGAEDAEPDSLGEALTGGRIWLKFRYRYEFVDQDGFAKDSNASTLRTLLGYETAPYRGFKAVLEFEDVAPVGEVNYNSTINGETKRPVVADPDGAEVNQVFVDYAHSEQTSGRLGRQRITLDNHRFIGNVGWRQNEQTFDAISISSACSGFDVFYAYLHNTNLVFGDDSAAGDEPMDSHLLNLSRDLEGVGKLSLYGYHLDYDEKVMLSTTTVGARLAGKHSLGEDRSLLYVGEAAKQVDGNDNPNDVDANYFHLEVGAAVGPVTVKVGGELLEGSGAPGDKFTTPLATLHAFNGWADKFLTTPDTGLKDTYASLGVKVDKVKLLAVYHEFEADSGGMDYGAELDLQATYPVCENVTVGVKYANYTDDSFATDTEKAWFWVGYAP